VCLVDTEAFSKVLEHTVLPAGFNYTLFLVDWINSARSAHCSDQESVIRSVRTYLVPMAKSRRLGTDAFLCMFHGNRGYMYDSVGPFQYAVKGEDAIGITTQGSTTIREQLSATISYALVNVTREPGVWNELWVSTEFRVFHWAVFALNLLLLLYGTYRLARTLMTRGKHILASMHSGRTSMTLARESHILLTVNGILFLSVSLLSLLERVYSSFLTVVSYFYWCTSFWTISLFHLAWSRVAYRVFVQDRRYKWLIVLTYVDTVVATLSAFGMVLALSIPTVYPVLITPAKLGFYVVSPLLYMVQGMAFITLGIQFLHRVSKTPLSPAVASRLQQMTLTGIALLLGNVIASVGAILFQFGSSPTDYVTVLALLSIAGWICQMAAFSVAAHFEDYELRPPTPTSNYAWTETHPVESDAFHSTVPLSALHASTAHDVSTSRGTLTAF
jgi:hypothetical protein